MATQWERVFETIHRKEPPASEGELKRAASALSAPLTPAEVRAIRSPSRKPSTWTLPPGTLPKSYRSFLKWSNGGEFQTGRRYFQMLRADELRLFLLEYNVPDYMPLAIPIAFDGSGDFFLLDVREGLKGDECPVVFASCGNLGFDDAKAIAPTFVAACRGRTNPEDG